MVVGGPSNNARASQDRSRSKKSVPDRDVGLICKASVPTAASTVPPMVGATSGHISDSRKHRLKSRFQVIKKLGQGTYGKVQLAVNKETGQQVAIKTIKKSKIESEQDLVRIRREIQIMSSIQHPHIVHIFEVFENNDKIVLVMQYASGGELYEYVSARNALSDQDARRLFRQIATAIYYCHKNKVCHRDLKLENILLDEKGNAKIGDFGLSNVFAERHQLTTFCGSPLYASPEIVKGTPYCGPEVDCWSMGVLLYTLVYGAMPFDGSNFKRLVKQISEANYFEPKHRSEASPLIRRLLSVNPKKRATIIDVCADPWVNSGFDTTLLTLAEDMANLTPVRLDILLELSPSVPKDTPASSQIDPQNITRSCKVDKSSGSSNCDLTTTGATSGKVTGDLCNSDKHRMNKSRGQQETIETTADVSNTCSPKDAPVNGSTTNAVNSNSSCSKEYNHKASSRLMSRPIAEVKPEQRSLSQSLTGQASSSGVKMKSASLMSNETAGVSTGIVTNEDDKSMDTSNAFVSTCNRRHSRRGVATVTCSGSLVSPTHAQGVRNKNSAGQLDTKAADDLVPSPGTVTSPPLGALDAPSDTHQVKADAASTCPANVTTTTTTSSPSVNATTTTCIAGKSSQQLKQEIEQKKLTVNESKQQILSNTSVSSKDSPVDVDSVTPSQMTPSHLHSSETAAAAYICSTVSIDKQDESETSHRVNTSSHLNSSLSPTQDESVTNELVTRHSPVKSSPSTLANGQRKHSAQEKRLISLNSPVCTKRVGRLSIPPFLDAQDKLASNKKPVPSYGSVLEAKKKLLERKESVQSETPAKIEHIFPTIPVKQAKTDVERRASLADPPPPPLTKGPHAVRLGDIDPLGESTINRLSKKVVTRRSTEPIIQSNDTVSPCLKNESTESDLKTLSTQVDGAICLQTTDAQDKSNIHLVNGKDATGATCVTGNSSSTVTTCQDSKPAPITRSYKKVSFTKDGVCITETGKVISQQAPDGTVTRIEQKSKITLYPSGVQVTPPSAEMSSIHSSTEKCIRDHFIPSNSIVSNSSSRGSSSSALKKSESASSSGSTDILDDIFDTWTSDSSMLLGCTRLKSTHPSSLFARRGVTKQTIDSSSLDPNSSGQKSCESSQVSSKGADNQLLSPCIDKNVEQDQSPFGPLFRGFPAICSDLRCLLQRNKDLLAQSSNLPLESPLISPFNQNENSTGYESLDSPIIRTPLACTFAGKKDAPSRDDSSSTGNCSVTDAKSSPPCLDDTTINVTCNVTGASNTASGCDHSADSAACRRRVEQWLDTSPDAEKCKQSNASASCSMYATIRPRPVSRYTRTLSSSVYDEDADDAECSASENALGTVPNTRGKRPVVQMRLTLKPGGVSTGSRIVYSASPHSTATHGEVTNTSASYHPEQLPRPQATCLLEQLRTQGYKHLVSQRLASSPPDPPASSPSCQVRHNIQQQGTLNPLFSLPLLALILSHCCSFFLLPLDALLMLVLTHLMSSPLITLLSLSFFCVTLCVCEDFSLSFTQFSLIIQFSFIVSTRTHIYLLPRAFANLCPLVHE